MPTRGAGSCPRRCCPRQRFRGRCAHRIRRAQRRRPRRARRIRGELIRAIRQRDSTMRADEASSISQAPAPVSARDSEVFMPPSLPSMSTSLPAQLHDAAGPQPAQCVAHGVAARDHVPVGRVGFDLLTRQRPAPRAPEVEPVRLADFDIFEHRAVGHGSPADGEIRGHECGQVTDGVVLARQDTNRGVEFGARPQHERSTLDARGIIDFVLLRIRRRPARRAHDRCRAVNTAARPRTAPVRRRSRDRDACRGTSAQAPRIVRYSCRHAARLHQNARPRQRFHRFRRAARWPLPTAAEWRALSARHTGIGFDQALVIEPPRRAGTQAYYRIFNADGGEVEQCGNGVRCLAAFLHRRGAVRLKVERRESCSTVRLASFARASTRPT